MAAVALLVSHLLRREKSDEECADPTLLANISTHEGLPVVPASSPVTLSSTLNRNEIGQKEEVEVRADTSQALLFRVSLPACFL